MKIVAFLFAYVKIISYICIIIKNTETMSKELVALKNHFESNCQIKVRVLEEKYFPHWKRLVFNSLNSDELLIIGNYIKTYFSKTDTYAHRIPKLSSYNGYLCLTFDIAEIREFIL